MYVVVTQPTAPDPGFGEFRLRLGERECTVVHRQALVSWLDEQIYLSQEETKQYGLVLWPASIALALEIGHRAPEFRGRRVLELGAGVGLPGIVAAAVGAHVLQTDRDAEALALCRENAARNAVSVAQRVADWAAWPDAGRHDWIIAADVLYRATLHEHLLTIFDAARAPAGRLLIADPLRSASLRLLERMEQEGWTVRMSRWTIGEGEDARTVGVFEVERQRDRETER